MLLCCFWRHVSWDLFLGLSRNEDLSQSGDLEAELDHRFDPKLWGSSAFPAFPTHLRLVIQCLVTCQDGHKRPEYPRRDDWNDQELTVLVLSSKPSNGAYTILHPRNLTWIPNKRCRGLVLWQRSMFVRRFFGKGSSFTILWHGYFWVFMLNFRGASLLCSSCFFQW